MKRCTRDSQVFSARRSCSRASAVEKASNSTGKISIAGVPSATLRTGSSTPRLKPSVGDRSAKRFAQDDGFVGGLNTGDWICGKHENIEKVTGSQDDVFCGSFDENIQNKLALMGLRP